MPGVDRYFVQFWHHAVDAERLIPQLTGFDHFSGGLRRRTSGGTYNFNKYLDYVGAKPIPGFQLRYALLNRFHSHEAVEDDFDADTEKKKISDAGGPVSQPGDMWRLGDHILICGDPASADTYARLLGKDAAQCAITSPPVDSKAYAKDGIDPWLERMAAVIRLLTQYAGIICWQTSDLAKTGSQFIEPLSMHSMKLFADENFRPLWIRVWKMSGNVPSAGALQASSNKPTAQYDYVTAFAGQETEGYNDQEYSWVSAFAAHSFQFVRRLSREERRKWGYAGVWEIAAMRKGADGQRQTPVELPWRCLKMHADLHSR